jgi:hypothetical protein
MKQLKIIGLILALNLTGQAFGQQLERDKLEKQVFEILRGGILEYRHLYTPKLLDTYNPLDPLEMVRARKNLEALVYEDLRHSILGYRRCPIAFKLAAIFRDAYQTGLFRSENFSHSSLSFNEEVQNAIATIKAFYQSINRDCSGIVLGLEKSLRKDISERFDPDRVVAKCTVNVPIETIERQYRQGRFIQLRELISDTLVLGCGLVGSGEADILCPHCESCSQTGARDFDTLSIDANINPSVVCFWGDPEYCKFSKKAGTKYSTIVDEGPIICFVEDKAKYWECIRLHLNPNGEVYIPTHILSQDGTITIPRDFVKKTSGNFPKLSRHASTVFVYEPGTN